MGGPVRPSGYLPWASATGVTNIAEPTDAQKLMGWAMAQQPPSSFENWLRNREDQAISYLRWKSELDPLVRDDFVRRPGVNMNPPNTIPTGIAGGLDPLWYTYFASGITRAQNAYYFVDGSTNAGVIVPSGGMGILCMQYGAYGPAEMYTRIDQLGLNDFKMEFVAALIGFQNIFPGTVKPNFEMGIFGEASGITGTSDLTFNLNPLGGWNIRMIPSGLAPTTASGYVNFFTSDPGSAFHKFTIESRGPTMAGYIDDVLALALPAVVIGPTGRLNFGVRVGTPSGAPFVVATGAFGNSGLGQIFIDKAELSVRRGPGTPV